MSFSTAVRFRLWDFMWSKDEVAYGVASRFSTFGRISVELELLTNLCVRGLCKVVWRF
jgi:hypothetical protein